MKQIILYFITAFIVSFNSSCDNNSENKSGISKNINADSSTATAKQHTSSNSLDWDGIYKGTLPCADCEGIETVITLNKDLTYSLKAKYLGKADNEYEEKGTFSWNTDGNSIKLIGVKDKPNQYLVGENKIVQLDMNGNKVTGPLAEKHVLVKQIMNAGDTASPVNAELVETYWKLTELMGKPVKKTPQGKREVHIIMKKQDNRIQGFGGCNSITGVYELKKGAFISFKNVASTLMACADMETEAALKKVLERADNYTIRRDTLSLNKARMAPLARFEAVYLR